MVSTQSTLPSHLDIACIRDAFPALAVNGPTNQPWLYFDGPGGTQVPQSVAQAISHAILFASANRGAPFATSQAVDALMSAASEDAAAFLGVNAPDRIVFGQNMTSLAFHASNAIIPTLAPGDEIIVSNLDHDANVAPWVHAAKRSGATVRHLDFCRHTMTLRPEDLAKLLSPKTKLIAFTAASNALGSLTPVADLVQVARAPNAIVPLRSPPATRCRQMGCRSVFLFCLQVFRPACRADGWQTRNPQQAKTCQGSPSVRLLTGPLDDRHTKSRRYSRPQCRPQLSRKLGRGANQA